MQLDAADIALLETFAAEMTDREKRMLTQILWQRRQIERMAVDALDMRHTIAWLEDQDP